MALPVSYRIKKKKDFDRIFKKGKAFNGSFLFLKSIPSSRPRFGFIIAGKVAPQAVTRNKVRRLFADVLWPDRLPNMAPYDTVVVVTKKVPQDLSLIRADFLAVLRNARLG